MQSFDFFDKLSVEHQNELLAHAQFMHVASGMQLYAQGDICQNILFLTKGRVRVIRQHENGQSVLLYYFERGEQCNVNFTSSYTSAPAIGTAIAETELEGYALPAELIARLFVEEKPFQQFVFDLYINRIETMASLIEEIRFGRLDERLVNWLESQEEHTLQITHEALGDLLGTSREVISRLLKGLEKEGKVRLSRKSIEILM